MNRAYCLIRDQPVYRREAFCDGLRAAGYDLRSGAPTDVRAGDLLVMWNRYFDNHERALTFERAGGIVLVAENGYVGVDRADRKIYALARGFHNGRGKTPVGGPERWDALSIALAPWKRGEHVLVSANRSFGTPGGIMPNDWMIQVRNVLEKTTKRPVKFRAHPGNDRPKHPFSGDLEGAHCVIIWSSSTGCEALIAGVPVFCMAPWWICKEATRADIHLLEEPLCDDAARLDAFQKLAWAQWHVDEIASGTAYRTILG